PSSRRCARQRCHGATATDTPAPCAARPPLRSHGSIPSTPRDRPKRSTPTRCHSRCTPTNSRNLCMTSDESQSATNTPDLQNPQWIASFHCGIREILGVVGRQDTYRPTSKHPQWTQRKLVYCGLFFKGESCPWCAASAVVLLLRHR